MPQFIQFQEFKTFASYLLQHKLQEGAELILKTAREENLPLLKKISHLSQEQLLGITKENLQVFLEDALHDQALPKARAVVDAWKNNLSPVVTPEQVELQDIVLVYHIRKKVLTRLLQGFTQEVSTALLIVEELDNFYQAIEQYAYEAYLNISQQELKKDKDFVYYLVNHTVNGIMAFDTDMRITIWNKVLESWNKLPKEQVLGKNIFDLFPNYGQTLEGKSIYKVLKGEKIRIEQQPYRSRKGYYEADAIPLFDEHGHVVGGFSIIRDITEHKLMLDKLKEQGEKLQAINEELREYIDSRQVLEEQLRQSRDYYLTILEDFPSLIWRANLEAKCDYFNKTWLNFTGRTLEQEWGDGWAEGVHPEDMERCVNIFLTAFKSRQPFDMEYRLRRHDGQYRWLIDFGRPIYDPKGEFTGYMGACFDIEEQKQAQKKIQEHQRFIERIAQASPSVIFVVDVTNFHVLYVNQDVLKLLGYSEGQIEERKLSQNDGFIHPEDMPKRNAYYASLQYIKGDEVKEVEYRVKDAQGLYRTFLTRSVLFVHDGQGKALQVMGISFDVTRRAQVEEEIHQKNQALQEAYQELSATQEELQQINEELYQTNSDLENRVATRTQELTDANKELNRKNDELKRTNIDLDNFIYTASHDLRAPIANLEGISSLLSRKLSDRLQEGELDLLGLVSRSILKLKKTIDDLTDIARVQKDLDDRLENLSFEQIFGEVYEGIASLADHAQAQIYTQFDASVVRFARKSLKSIMYNLLSNAIKYRADGRVLQIQVHTYHEADYTVLSVSDNGLGIPEKQKDKLFKMFKRLHSHVEGTGIGLYIVKRVVENSGGKIEVTSTEGQGSAFKIYFQTVAANPAASGPAGAGGHG
jgi:PAS domain S-box-containing protein